MLTVYVYRLRKIEREHRPNRTQSTDSLWLWRCGSLNAQCPNEKRNAIFGIG